MKIINTVDEAKRQVREWREEGCSVGLVPTMGFLHAGHQSLIQRAVSENSKVAVSIFVNPTQFSPTEDYDRYPRDLNADSELCEKTGAHMIFHPSVNEMYGDGYCTFVGMDRLTDTLCGKSRPSHFQGVCTVVNKLMHIIKADRAYFGLKDAQQLAVIKRMVEDLNMDVDIVACPLVREPDGLAVSSRNSYLSPAERKAATVLSKSLFEAKEFINAGERNAGKIISLIKAIISSEAMARIDYVEIVDGESMEKLEVIKGNALIAVAVFIGRIRLIDNIAYKEENLCI